jgi:hypothetical protein
VSLCFPIKFLRGSQYVPQNVLNIITLLCDMFCLELSSFHLYRWASSNINFYFGEAIKFQFVFFVFLISRTFCDEPIKMTHCQKKKSWTWEALPFNEYKRWIRHVLH